MPHPQQKLLEVMVKEAFDCFKRGEHESGKELLYLFFDKFDPSILKDSENLPLHNRLEGR